MAGLAKAQSAPRPPIILPAADVGPRPKALDDGRVDMTGRYNTKLSPEEEAKFQEWARKNPRLGSTADYDARGFWKDGGKAAENGHGADKWKKPNHPTFSTGSVYHGVDGNVGGEWAQTGDKWSFKASKTNMDNMGSVGMQKYFDKVEPGNKLILPSK